MVRAKAIERLPFSGTASLFPEALFPEALFPEALFPEALFPEALFPESGPTRLATPSSYETFIHYILTGFGRRIAYAFPFQHPFPGAAEVL
jgi:hypothetical protein